MLQTGQLLSERYRILGKLGQGGMGCVYRAQVEAFDNKLVAVKELLPKDEQPAAVEQFRREASFLANLRHPNLVQVTDFFSEDGRYYLVMELVEGVSLNRLVQGQNRAQIRDVLTWANQLCDVLAYLHGQDPPVLFRDLKPSNIMLDGDGQIRLIDFGIARRSSGQTTSTFLQGVGSAGYAPLEQYDDQETTDARSDVYALGATLHHLLTGQVPASAVARASGTELAAPGTSVPPSLKTVIMRCLALKPPKRYQTITEVREALEKATPPEIETPELDVPTETLDLDGTTEALAEEQGPKPGALMLLLMLLGVFALAVLASQSSPPLNRIETTLDLNQADYPNATSSSLALASGLSWLNANRTLTIENPERLPSALAAPNRLGKAEDPTSDELAQALRFELELSDPAARVSLKTSGWRQSNAASDAPSTDSLRQALEGLGAVWVNIGWYQYNGERKLWRRGGQWVTVVDCDGQTLKVLDPSSLNGDEPAIHTLTATSLVDVQLLGNEAEIPEEPLTILKLSGEFATPTGTEEMLLDAVLVMTAESK